MFAHFLRREKKDETGKIVGRSFWATVVQIELMDLSLSIDNVVAAVALSKNLIVVITGVFIGILALRLLAGLALRLMQRFPALGPAAYLLVGYVGVLLLIENLGHVEIGSATKFIGIAIIVAAAMGYDWVARSRRSKDAG